MRQPGAMAPIREHCGMTIEGHGVEAGDRAGLDG
jgi:hypothetical protein